MTAADLAEFQPEWVTPITTDLSRLDRLRDLPPNTQGIAALMMLNLMEQFPLGEYGFHSADALHVMIEAKKLAYADMLRYVGDPRFAQVPVDALLEQAARGRARQADRPGEGGLRRSSRRGSPASPTRRAATPSTCRSIDKDGNIVSLIQSNYSGFGSGLVPPGTGFMLHNRGGLFTLEKDQPNMLAPRKRPLHTIIPAFMEKGESADRLRHHGRMEPGAGARAVRRPTSPTTA